MIPKMSWSMNIRHSGPFLSPFKNINKTNVAIDLRNVYIRLHNYFVYYYKRLYKYTFCVILYHLTWKMTESDKKKFYQSLGDRIKEVRMNAKMKQEAFASHLKL